MIETVGAFLLKNGWAIIAGLIGYILWLGRLEWTARQNVQRIEKLEERLDKDREDFKAQVASMRTEMLSNFQIVNATLEKVIFRLGDRNNGNGESG